MRVVHLCLACFFPDNHTYQENLLPKYHQKLGHEVTVIASTQDFDENGNICFGEARRYINENQLPVIRLPYKINNSFGRKFKFFSGLYSCLVETKPEVIFIHGCQFLDMRTVVKYVKAAPDVIVYVDNHADFTNSARNALSYLFLHRFLWKACAQMIEPYTTRFYGVLPSRVNFLEQVYKLPQSKIQLLVMGVDDENLDSEKKVLNRKRMRESYSIGTDDFLIISGGKIDKDKTEIFLLLETIKQLNNPKVKLILFGSIIDTLKETIMPYVDGNTVQYIGWQNTKELVALFDSADLAVFPGRHSVLWEQACGQGLPLIVKSWPGTRHIDLGGNALFWESGTEEELGKLLCDVLNSPEKYSSMKYIAEEKGPHIFAYSQIAARSLEL